MPFTLLGAGLLWFGWFGFNAGSALAASPIAGLAFVTTMFAPAATLVVWTFLDVMRSGKPTAVGAATAIVVGLVAITPAAGFISPMLWGDEVQVRARFAMFGVRPDRIQFERSTWFFRHPGQPSDLLAIFRDFYGPTMNAFEAASKSGKAAELQRELGTAVRIQVGKDAKGRIEISFFGADDFERVTELLLGAESNRL